MSSGASSQDHDVISFACTREEFLIIAKIVKRAVALRASFDMRMSSDDVRDLAMDIEATHCNGCRLRLKEWLAADDFNFAHDIGGIQRHIDRRTGKLTGCFLPRFAAPQAEVR